MGKLKEWTLFPQSVSVQAEDEESAIAKAKTEFQKLLSHNELEFEDIVDEGKVETQELNEEEIVNTAHKSNKVQREFEDDEDY